MANAENLYVHGEQAGLLAGGQPPAAHRKVIGTAGFAVGLLLLAVAAIR